MATLVPFNYSSLGDQIWQSTFVQLFVYVCIYHSVPQIRPPPFCSLSLSTKRRETYTRDATIALAITPSLPVKRDLIVCGGWGQARDREMLPSLAVG